MTAVQYDNLNLRLDFSRWEALWLRRSQLEVPLTSIERIEVLPGWTSEVLGLRNGLVVSGYLKIATFLHPSGMRRLVTMRQGAPILRIGLRGHEFDELLISTPAADQVADGLRSRSH
ncbi:hypothetical protein ACI2LF_12785 [Kribbella sp. NPDC020789]